MVGVDGFPQGAGDPGGNLILHGKNIVKFAVILFGPNVVIADRINKLRGDPDPIGGAPDTAFQDILHTQFAGDLSNINGPPLVDKRRVARDDEELVEAGECGDDVLGYAVGEKFLFRVVGHIVERQHRDGWLVGQWQGIAISLDGCRFTID